MIIPYSTLMDEIEKISSRSISPNLLKSLSPLRVTSRLINYGHTRKQIANISKTLFKADTDKNPILNLERAVLRGEGSDYKEKKTMKKLKLPNKSKLDQYLKSEHKIKNNGIQIVKLPKLPYGLHRTYNEEEYFTDHHFVTEGSDQEQQKELSNISKQFKLKERIKAKKIHKYNKSAVNASNLQELYHMDSGFLVVPKEQRIIDSYEADKGKYAIKHHYAYQTFRDINFELDSNLSKRSTVQQLLEQDSLIKSLKKPPSKKKLNVFVQKLNEKYSALFGDN